MNKKKIGLRINLPTTPVLTKNYKESDYKTERYPAVRKRERLPYLDLRTQRDQNESQRSVRLMVPNNLLKERESIYKSARVKTLSTTPQQFKLRISDNIETRRLKTIDQQLDRMNFYLKKSMQSKLRQRNHMNYMLHLSLK